MQRMRTWMAGSLVAVAGVSVAQPAQLWAQRININSASRESAAAVIRDGASNTVTVGHGYVGASPLVVGGTMVLRKLNNTGTQVWTREVQPARGGTFQVYGAAMDGGGNFAVVYTETGLFTGTLALGSVGAKITKFRGSDGATLWTSDIQAEGLFGPVGIMRDASNHFLVAGNASAGIGVVKVNGASGAPLWFASRQPAGRFASASAFAVDGAGNVAVVGTSQNTQDCSTANNDRGYVARFTTAGAFSWEQNYTLSSLGDRGVDIGVDGANNFFALFDSVDSAGNRAVTAKYNGASGGAPMWTNAFVYPTTTSTSARRIGVAPSGAIYVGGEATVSFLPTLLAWYYLPAGGAALWSRTLGNSGFGFSTNTKSVDFAFDSGNHYIAASITDFMTFKGQYFATRVNPGTGVSVWTKTYAPANRDNSIVGAVANSTGVSVHGTSTLSPSSLQATKRYAIDGSEPWTFTNGALNRARFEGMNAIARDGSGNTYVTGSSNGAIITAKYNSAGVRQWLSSNDAGSPESFASIFEGGYDLVVAANGDAIVAGQNRGNCVVMRLNGMTGAVIWRRPMSAVSMPFRGNRSLVIDGSGNVFLAKEQDGLIGAMKINGATGGLLWNKTYTPPAGQNAEVVAIALDSQGNVVIAGHKGLTTGECGSETENYQLIAIKYTTAVGAQVWVGVYQPPLVGHARAADIYLDSANNAAVFGTVDAAVGTQTALVRFAAGNGAIQNSRVYQMAGTSMRATKIVRDNLNHAYPIADVYGSNFVDALVWKWSNSGAAAPLWTRRLSGVNGNNGAAGAVEWAASGLFATGARDNNVDVQMATYEINPGNGAVVWSQFYNPVAGGASAGMDLLCEPGSTNVLATGISSGTNSSMDGVTARYRQ